MLPDPIGSPQRCFHLYGDETSTRLFAEGRQWLDPEPQPTPSCPSFPFSALRKSNKSIALLRALSMGSQNVFPSLSPFRG